MTQTKKNIAFVFLITIVFLILSFFVLFSDLIQYENNKSDFYKRFVERSSINSFDGNLLTHELIKIDYDYGITTKENKDKALYNVNMFLNAVSLDCKQSETYDYIKCANEKLRDNFYYKPSIEVSNNYANHISDCDTNSYLMIDALSLVGIKGFIVYAPSHAFIGWIDDFGNPKYWETTTNNNTGKEADLSESFYTKTFDRTYYKLMPTETAIDVYTVLISAIENAKVDVESFFMKNKDNSIISDFYYYDLSERNKISNLKSMEIESLIATDITSNDKYYALANYHLMNNNIEKGKWYFTKIDKGRCGSSCYKLGLELNIPQYEYFAYFYKKYSEFHKEKGMDVNVKIFFRGFFIFCFSLLFLLISLISVFFMKKVSCKSSKSQSVNTKDMKSD
ncbi:TPA: hypothetical protein N1Y87_004229 [Salmonella enterica subsp. enterica serovar Infantis]|nr:hypothetical protein [Salmonella enterica subsp. enterica serovar Infantis]